MLKWIRELQAFLHIDCGMPYWLVHPVRSFHDWKHVRKYNIGDIVEDCSYHPCIIISIDRKHGDVELKSLLTNRIGNCSLFHCGIIHMTEDEVKKAQEAYYKDSKYGLMKLHGWTDE